jgi:hypothetical protein
MTLKRVVLTALAALVVAYALLILMMTPLHATSGSGEGNILTTQTP